MAPLFAWIESEFQDHGPQAWAVLKERVTQTPHVALALHLMAAHWATPEKMTVPRCAAGSDACSNVLRTR